MIYQHRANAKCNLKLYSGAVSDYTTALSRDPDEVDSYYFRGLARLDLGQQHEAALDFAKAAGMGSAKAIEAVRKYC